MLKHTGGASLPSREQFTQSSVHRLQFGGPCWIEIFSGAGRGGSSISAAEAAAPASVAIVRTATAKTKCRMPRSASSSTHPVGNDGMIYRYSTLVISYALAPPGATTSTLVPF